MKIGFVCAAWSLWVLWLFTQRDMEDCQGQISERALCHMFPLQTLIVCFKKVNNKSWQKQPKNRRNQPPPAPPPPPARDYVPVGDCSEFGDSCLPYNDSQGICICPLKSYCGRFGDWLQTLKCNTKGFSSNFKFKYKHNFTYGITTDSVKMKHLFHGYAKHDCYYGHGVIFSEH